jgi:hypothetical protein
MSDTGWLILAVATSLVAGRALDAASGGANRGDGGAEGRRIGARSRRAGSPTSECGGGQAHAHQEREGGRGAADHNPRVGEPG